MEYKQIPDNNSDGNSLLLTVGTIPLGIFLLLLIHDKGHPSIIVDLLTIYVAITALYVLGILIKRTIDIFYG